MKNNYEEGQTIKFESDVGDVTGVITETPPFKDTFAGTTISYESKVKVNVNPGNGLDMFEVVKINNIQEIVEQV